MIQRILLVGVGGFFGAVGRFLVGEGTRILSNSPFPYGTLTVNTIGSFLLAFLAASLFEPGGLSSEYRLLFLTGFLGAFTTFSTFSYESLNLLRDGLNGHFLLNVAANVLLCLVGAALGLYFGGLLSR